MFTQMPSDIFIYTIFAGVRGERKGGKKWDERGRKFSMAHQRSTMGTLSSLSRDADVVIFYSHQILSKKSVERLLVKELSDDMSPFVASFGRQWSGIIASLFREKDYQDRVGVFGSLWTGSSHLSTPSEMLIVSRKKGSLCWRTLFFLAMTSTRRSFP